MILYHGTSLKNLKSIAKKGILPRGIKGKSNWETGIGKSRYNLVYLTNCYACYYASMACNKKDDKPVVLKLNIDEKKMELYPDEEFLFRSSGLSKQPNAKKALKIYNNIDPIIANFFNTKTGKRVSWKDSLNYMGTVTARFIPKECIIGYAMAKRDIDFLLNCDPCVSPLNYKFCGDNYKVYLNSLEYKKLN